MAAHAFASSLVSPADWSSSPTAGARNRPAGSMSKIVDSGTGAASDTRAVPIRDEGETRRGVSSAEPSPVVMTTR